MWRRRRPTDDEFRDEIEAHVAIETDRLIAEGRTPDDAARAANRGFGNTTRARERFRESARIMWLDDLLQDVRFAFRSLGRAPGFATVAVLILAIGIGANTAIFGVVNAVLLRPLPYADPERLVLVDPPYQRHPEWLTRPWRERARSLVLAGFTSPEAATLLIRGEPTEVQSAKVTWDFFPLLGVAPAFGRLFAESDAQANPTDVAVLSHHFWVRHFGSDPAAVGGTVTLTGERLTIVGVVSREFRFPTAKSRGETVRFAGTQPDVIRLSRSDTFLQVVGRLAPGSTPRSASDELTAVFKQEGQDHFSASYLDRTSVVAAPLQEALIGDAGHRLLLLMGAVSLVLLVACANVANLVLARLSNRQPELAVRAALGARRGRLVRMVLTETVMLAVVASAAASSLSYWTAEIVRAMLAAEVSHVDAIGLDWRVLAFNLVTAATVGVLSGIASFMIVQSRDLAGALHHGGNRSATGRHRLRRALLAAEVAVTFVLVVSAGLLTRTLWNLYNLPRGFDGSRVVTAAVMPNMAGTIPEIQNVSSSFFDDLTERVGRLPGVEAAAAASNIPFSGRSVGSSGVWLVGEARPAEELFVTLAAVTPAYFTTIGATLTTGREFDRRDVAGRQRVAMVNETLRRTLAGDRNVVGALLQFGQLQLTVVGIVRDLPDTSLRAPAETFVYVPMSQTVGSNFAFGRLTILARTRHPNPSTLVPALRQTVWGLGDDVIIDEVATMNERLAASVRAERDSALLFGVLAALALLVAVAGIYGVVAYSVAQRTREIGIRIALGAARARVIGDIVLEAARPVVAGIVIGAAGALLATRALTTVLFQTEPMDSPTLAATALILGGTALVAAWIPARRAAQVDPVTALRAE